MPSMTEKVVDSPTRRVRLAGDTDDALAEALNSAWRDPGSTFLGARHPIGPTLDDAATAYLDWWRGGRR